MSNLEGCNKCSKCKMPTKYKMSSTNIIVLEYLVVCCECGYKEILNT